MTAMFAPRLPVLHPSYLADSKYPTFLGSCVSAAPAAVDRINFYPFLAPATISFLNGVIRVVTGQAGSAIKAAIYANSPVSMKPLGAPLFADNTGVATTGAGDVVAAIGAGTILAGTMVWIATKETGTLPSLYSLPSLQSNAMWLAGASVGVAANVTSYALANAYANAFPIIAEGTSFLGVADAMPHMWLQT